MSIKLTRCTGTYAGVAGSSPTGKEPKFVPFPLIHTPISIKFTVERGSKTINYLDLTLTWNSEGIGYKIYRKPTCTDTIIRKDSFHHPKRKMAAMENYCHRAMTTLKDKEERKKEIQVVKQIARVNGYQPEDVDRVVG